MPDPEPPQLPEIAEARRLLDVATVTGEPARIAHAQVVLGAALHERHQPALALEAFERAEAGYDAAGDPGAAASCRINRAVALSSLGRSTEAVALFEALAADPAWTASAMRGLADHHHRRDEVAEALAAMRRLRHVLVTDQPELVAGLDLEVAGWLLEGRSYAEAAAAFAALVPTYDAAGDQARVGYCQLSRGIALHRAGDTAGADRAYVDAMTAYTIADDHEAVETARHNLNVLRGRFT